MRRLIFVINMSLDGCVDHTKQIVAGEGREYLQYFVDLMLHAGMQIFGRKTYELMVPYWPDVANDPSSSKEDVEFARAFQSLDKVVFSRSLSPRVEGNTRVVNTDLREEILRLKNEEGKDILVGGVDVPSQLITLGLIDEIRVIIGPTIVGEGRRLFDHVLLPDNFPLKLTETKVFGSGRVALRYLTRDVV
ncbi:MAG: dihydrofolate reductase [Acidobacteria bacterium]|nr:dihydrofolate reductase [Acidobacteriota bacterium]